MPVDSSIHDAQVAFSRSLAATKAEWVSRGQVSSKAKDWPCGYNPCNPGT